MNFCVKVLPFELEPSPIDYSLFYFGILPSTTSEEQKVGITDSWKSPEQYAAELQDMRDHGVLYPTLNQWYSNADPDNPALNLALSLRNQAGLPKNNIYLMDMVTGNPTSAADLATLKQNVIDWKTVAAQNGYQNIYVYGMDEANGKVLLSERPAWQTVHSAGGKVFVALGTGNTGAVTLVGDLLDVAVYCRCAQHNPGLHSGITTEKKFLVC